ncbi:Uncharacterized protein MSYG_1940 [Malassezia sympodialis ATCC 42132]|uniref:Translin n=1 Tax=Malassezia sympodialis (strain ATCC 42132) TaxID=1230383 RepID=A0A1M8A5D5_MALS4|nr:Uncharacterized protein MSYG_1940 [Malassezia sympodialis ATCC 42132]
MPPGEGSLVDTFTTYRDEIDAFHDRRERLIKTSRDVTALSKKLIFHLHRYACTDAPDAYASAHTKLQEISLLLHRCGKDEELAVPNGAPHDTMNRFERFLGPSLEEWIEAASFLHFLEQDALISYEDVQALLVVDGLQCVYVTPMRYLLGLSDLTGELMRYAINAIASHNPLAKIERVLQMQYTIYSALEPLAATSGELRKKQQVTLSSIRKVEDAAYTIRVRSAEFSNDPATLQEVVRRALAAGEECDVT